MCMGTISCQVFYIVPTLDSECSTDSCLTISQFAEIYVPDSRSTYPSNTTLVIVGENHDLNKSISVSNVAEFSMLSANGTEPNPGPVTITCSEHASFNFRNISTVFVRGFKFAGCSNNRIELVNLLIVDKSMFHGQTGSKTSLTIVNSTAQITKTTFVANAVGTALRNLNPLPVLNYPVSLSASATLGGALIVSSSEVMFDTCLFQDNEANIGGAIYSEQESNITITNSTFRFNRAKCSNSGLCFGGGLFVNGPGTLRILSSNFANNTSDQQGGMAALFNASLSISLSSFIANSAISKGGSIFAQTESSVLLNHSTLIESVATSGGAIYARNYSNITISSSILSNCTANTHGGAVFLAEASNVYLYNSTFYANSAANGGVISTDESGDSVNNVTGCNIFVNDSDFEHNSANPNGGVFFNSYFSTTEVYRSKFKNNQANKTGGVFTIKHYSEVTMTGSEFGNNSASVGAVIYARNVVDTKIYDCDFINNSAEIGGANYVRERSNFLVDNGRFTNNSATKDGGSLYALMQCMLTISNSTFSENAAAENGGVMFIKQNSTVTFNNQSVFINNRAMHGGVVRLEESTMAIYDSMFDDNHASINGGVINGYNVMSIHNSNFSNNRASNRGGISFISESSIIEVYRSQFSNNTAGFDAGVHYAMEGSNITIRSCEFSGNSAKRRGGIICAQRQTSVTIKSSSFNDNTVDRYGGVVHLEDNNVMEIYNSTFDGNHAGIYGGVINAYNVLTSISIHNSNFSNNRAGSKGGVSHILDSSLIVMNQSRFFNNTAGVDAGVHYAMKRSNITTHLCEFNGNAAKNRGGVINAQRETSVTIESSSFIENVIDRYGGVVHLEDNNVMEIYGSNFSGNHAGVNGGVISAYTMADVSINTSNFDGNKAEISGGVSSISYGSVFAMSSSQFSNNNAGVDAGVHYAVHETDTTIDSCEFNLNSADYGGVLLTLRISNITIYNATFRGNAARIDGGTLYGHTNCSFSIFDSYFLDNLASSNGVLLASDNSSVEIINSTFTNNTAGNIGGVLYVYDYSCVIASYSMFIGNRAYDSGGIVYGRKNSSFTFISSEFINNLAESSGGIVYVQQGSILTIEFSDFVSNTADYGGIAFIYVQSHANITNSNFTDNRGNIEGGVIAAYKSSIVRMETSTFTSNTAIYGGVAHAYNNSYLLFQDNIYRNNSADVGGVIRIFQNAVAIITGETFDHNSGFYGGVLYTLNAKADIGNCSLSNSYSGYRGGTIYAESGVINLTECTISNSMANDAGGAIALYNYSDVSVIACKFLSNSAQSSGGVVDVQLQSKLKVTDSSFRFSEVGGFGGVIHARRGAIIDINGCIFIESNADANGGAIDLSLNSSLIMLANSSFVNNSAQSGGAISLEYTERNAIFKTTFQFNDARDKGGAIAVSMSSKINITQCNFTQNTAKMGAAFAALQNSTIAIASLNSNETELEMISSTHIQNNEGKDYGGGIYLSGSDISFSTIAIFNENQVNGSGGGIYAINSSITVRSTITLSSNQAHSGGGICLANSKLYTKTDKGVRIHANFISNHANYGGGIYVDDKSVANLCYHNLSNNTFFSNQSECFFESEDNSFTIDFTDNYADFAGSNLYGGLLDRCNVANEMNRHDPSITGAMHFIGISNITNIDSISSEPVRVCYCYNSVPDCGNKEHNIKLMRGDVLNVSIAAVDQVSQPVNATVRSSFRNLVLSNSQTIQTIGAECSTIPYQLSFPREATKYELIIYAEGPCNDVGISELSVNIEVLKCICGRGFMAINNTNRCICDCDNDEVFMKYIQTCNYSTKSVTRKGTFWIDSELFNDTESSSAYFIYPYCPLDYCQPPNKEIPVNLNLRNGSDAQCANNRGGLLCGRCLPDYCLSLGSSKCLEIPDKLYEQAVGILISAFLAGIILVVLILFLNLTVAVGTLNSIIFYANIINAHKTTYFDQSSVVFAPVSVLISWLNLDIGIDACFYEELDAYAKTWLQLAFPTYIMFLVILIIWISSCSTKFSNLLGKRNPVATLATLILLSYATLLQTIIKAFSLIKLTYPNKNKELLWLPDPNIRYGQGKHIALICVSIVILFFGMLYTLLIFSWQYLLHSPKSRVLKWTRNQKLHSFIDMYHIPHSAKHRYWTGLLLLVRVIVYLISAFTTSIDPRITLLTTALIMCCLFLYKNMLIIRVYKNWLLNSMESFAYFNIATLTLFTWYTFDDERNGDLQKIVANISVGATLLQLIFIIVFHAYRYGNTKLYIRLSEKIKDIMLKYQLSRDHDQNSDHLPSTESVLLDAIDSPRVRYAPFTRKVQKGPTSSTVSLTDCDHDETHEDIPKRETVSREKPRSQSSIAKNSLRALTEFHLTRKSEPKVFTFPSQAINESMRKPLLESVDVSNL